jgi:hypothetical protein
MMAEPLYKLSSITFTERDFKTSTLKLATGPSPHVFVPITVTSPETAELVAFTVIEFVPAPEVIEKPVGTVQE